MYVHTRRKLKWGEKPSKSFLYELYIIKNMTQKQIAKIFGKSPQSIKGYLKEYGIYKEECQTKHKFLKDFYTVNDLDSIIKELELQNKKSLLRRILDKIFKKGK